MAILVMVVVGFGVMRLLMWAVGHELPAPTAGRDPGPPAAATDWQLLRPAAVRETEPVAHDTSRR